MTLATPYKDVLPPLRTEEREALRISIETEGVRNACLATEDGRLLDGHNRLDIDPKAPVAKIPGSAEWSDAECKAFIYRCNRERRNLSPTQRKELEKREKETAKQLREVHPVSVVAQLLGVSRQLVSYWLGNDAKICDISNLPNSVVKVPPQERETIYFRCERDGEDDRQVAADYGISDRQVRNIVSRVRKDLAKKAEVDALLKATSPETEGIIVGDFREKGEMVGDETVQLIFTDPPYDEEAVVLYGDLAKFAARILIPGGLCLAYAGHSFLPDIYRAMDEHLEYVWTFAIQHSGGDLRFRKWKLQNKWKPVLCFGKPPVKCWWDWFPDMSTGSREKDAHPWQQAENEAEHFINSLSRPGALICEPFCGGGTTCVAAGRLGRKFVAFEINEESARKAAARLRGQQLGEAAG